jgi:protein SCO1/2
MAALTGTPEQVKVASRAYKTFYQRQEGDPDYYLVDHSTQSYFVLPEQGIVQPFGRQIRPDRMAEQMACMMDAL